MSDQFARDVCRVVVSQICHNLGFEAVQLSALDTLTDVLVHYIEEAGSASHAYAEISNRTEANFNDTRLALFDLGTDIMHLVEFQHNAPPISFPRKVPRFPITIQPRNTPELRTEPIQALPDHIPSFLPPFPDSHTYINTPVFQERELDPAAIRKRKGKRKRQVEDALTKLSQPLGDDPHSSHSLSSTLLNSTTSNSTTNTSSATIRTLRDTTTTRPSSALRTSSGTIINPYLLAPRNPKSLSGFNSSTTSTSTGIPQPTPVTPSPRHIVYMEVEEDQIDPEGDDRVHRHVDVEDEAERTRKLQKCEKILSHPVTGVRTVVHHSTPTSTSSTSTTTSATLLLESKSDSNDKAPNHNHSNNNNVTTTPSTVQ